MFRILLVIIILITTLHQSYGSDANALRTTAKTCTKPDVNELFIRNYGHRQITYNAVGLTKEQVAQKEAIDAKRFEDLQPKYEYLDNEVFTLRKLRASNAKKSQIKKQEYTVKKIRKNIDKIDKKYDKEFMSCLTSLQKAKYRDIQRLHRRDIYLKINDADSKYYDEGMPIFGQE